MTKQEFGQSVKAKYPQYKDLDDVELADKVLAKYPVYQYSMNIEDAPSSATPSPQKGVRGAAGLAVGAAKGVASFAKETAQLGEKVFQSGLKAVLPKSAEEKLGLGETGVEALERELPQLKSATTAEGTAEKIGFGIEKIAELAVPMAKVGKLTKGASLARRIGAEGLTSAGTVAAQSGGDVKETATAGVIGAALPGAGAVAKPITGAAAKFITERLPQRLVRSAVGQSNKELIAGKDVSKYVIENKRIGTANMLIKSAREEIDKLDSIITKNISSVKDKVVSRQQIVDDIVEKVNADGGATDATEVLSAIESLAPQARGLVQKETLTLSEAHRLRQLIDRTLGDRAFLGGQLTYNKELLKSFNDSLRETVKELAPEGTRKNFESLAKEITLRNAVLNKYTGKDRNQILRLGDFLGGGLGVLGGGLPGAVIGAGVSRVAQSPATLTLGAVGLGQLKRLETVVSSLTPELKAALIQMLRD